VEFAVGGRSLGTAGSGGFFGELALLRDAPRSASVTAMTPLRAFRLDRDGFDRLIADAFRGGRLRETVDRTWEH
jgi:CRP-like cAMP-binding protein